MEQLIYTSVASETFAHGDLFDITQASARSNPGRDITGFLLFKNGRFMQMVEGPSQGLDDLLGKLEGDHRHHSIEVLERSEVADRLFPRWTMKRFADGSLQAALEEISQVCSGHRDRSKIADQITAFMQ